MNILSFDLGHFIERIHSLLQATEQKAELKNLLIIKPITKGNTNIEE